MASKPDKQKTTDTLEKEMERLIRKLDNEKQALTKIIRNSGGEKNVNNKNQEK